MWICVYSVIYTILCYISALFLLRSVDCDTEYPGYSGMNTSTLNTDVYTSFSPTSRSMVSGEISICLLYRIGCPKNWRQQCFITFTDARNLNTEVTFYSQQCCWHWYSVYTLYGLRSWKISFRFSSRLPSILARNEVRCYYFQLALRH